MAVPATDTMEAENRFPSTTFPSAPWVLFVHSMRRTGFNLGWHLILGLVLIAYFIALTFFESPRVFVGAPGLELYRWITYANLILICIAGVGSFSVCVASEREAGTLDLLRLANVGPLGFLFGRWLPLLVATAILLALQIPCATIAVTLGGILPNQIQATTIVTLVHLFMVASVGFQISVFSKSTQRAVLVSTIVFGCCFAGPDVAKAVCVKIWPVSSPQVSTFIEKLRSFSAFGSMERIEETARTGLSLWGNEQTWQLLLGVVALVFASLNLERQSLSGTLIAVGKARRRHAFRWRLGLAAIFQKDFYQAGGWNWFVIRLFIYPIAGTIYGSQVSVTGPWYVAAVTHELALRMVGWDTAIVLSQIFQREIQQETWGGLTILPISRIRICYAKLAGAFVALLPGWVWTLYASFDLGMYGRFGADWLHIVYFTSIVVFGLHFAVLMSIVIPRVTWTIPCMLGVVAAHLKLEFSRTVVMSMTMGPQQQLAVVGLLGLSFAMSAGLHILTAWIISETPE